MRTRAAIASILASTAVLVGAWELGTAGTTTSAPLAASAGTSTGPGSTSGPATTPSAAASAPTTTPATTAPAAAAPVPAAPVPAAPATTAPAAASTDGTFTGSAVSTRFGGVQVAITVSGGQITDVAALQLTDKDGRSVSISNRAAPILRQEVLAAQSASVQSVSGATYTSDAYLTSLQSALDQAGL